MKKNLLFINGHLETGGGERSLTDLLKHMDFTRYSVDLLLFEGLGEYAAELPEEVNVIFYDITNAFGSYRGCMKKAIKNKDGFAFMFRNIRLLQRLFGAKALWLSKGLFKRLKKRYDCVVAYRPGICTDFAAFAVRADKKVSWWHHGALQTDKKGMNAMRRSYRRMDFIAVVSENCRQMLLKGFADLKDKFVTIPNIVDKAAIKGKAALYQTDMDISGDCINLVSVGRLSPEKNMAICPRVCKLLTDRGYNIKWTVIGSGVQEEEIREKTEQYAVQNAVVLTGPLSNPYPYMKAADIYVHPSLVESQGISILEALALEKPVVVVRSLGPLEFIKNKENGVLTGPTAESICGGVETLLEDPGLLAAVTTNASAATDQYQPDRVLPLFYHLIEAGKGACSVK